ncbi:MAG: non-ribosomal peptide synthetase, partial [Acidobacteriota bacterium]|nr:non-ribosomal peptide synthetase [Acidobacteriota bacterium]
MQKQTIAITATFTAELIEESLGFWMQELSVPFNVEFAPYNQVFQQLLDPASLLSTNQRGVNVVLVRFEDWGKVEDSGETGSPSNADEEIERNVRDLLLALKSATGRSATPHLVCLCPASKASVTDQKLTTFFQRMEDLIVSGLHGMSGVYSVTTSELATVYPVAIYDDPRADKLGHVPYTQAFFAALGTIIARKIHSLKSAPYKVIALDCDQTLWKGVCGEDGPHGIEIDPPRKALQ